jgi:D-alanyl-D-alanine carboxypeptidase (penicillin-binding protein 5/6)
MVPRSIRIEISPLRLCASACDLFLPLVFILFAFFTGIQGAAAQTLPLPEPLSQSAVVMDAATGFIVFSKNPDDEIPPASLTKLMAMHLVFMDLAAGRASLNEIIVPGKESWWQNQLPGSSLMWLDNGHRVSLRELLLGLAVSSGNDAATAVALRFAPTVEEFVGMMNREAAALGLTKTRFVDAAGYWEFNMTTAREFAEFCRMYLAAYPESLKEYHSVRELIYPRTRIQRNRNTLLGRVEGVDGLKTGSIPEAGFNIALTAERNGTRFIAVILGAPAGWGGDRIRDADGEKLLEWAFACYKTIRPEPGVPEPARIWKGRENYAGLVFAEPLTFTALAERGEDLSWTIEHEPVLIAPLPAGSRAGNLVISDSLGELRRIPLLTAAEAEKGGFFKRLFDSIRLFFAGLSSAH